MMVVMVMMVMMVMLVMMVMMFMALFGGGRVGDCSSVTVGCLVDCTLCVDSSVPAILCATEDHSFVFCIVCVAS